MKKFFLTSVATRTLTSLLIIVTVGSVALPQPAAAATYLSTTNYYNRTHPFNLMFKLHGENRKVTTYDELRAYLEDLIDYLQELHDSLPSGGGNNYDEIDIVTRAATNISDDSATLHGEVTDLNGASYANAWFEYGRNKSSLGNVSNTVRINRNTSGNFDLSLDGLIHDTTYYFQAVADNPSGDTSYGSLLHFTTDTNGNTYSTPDVTTKSASGITTHSAHLRGSVDMNDFDSGHVFFVYGEDETMVDSVPDDFDTYADVDEDSDNLQKVSIDTNFDESGSFDELVSGLDSDTDHYYRLCVAYQDDTDDDTLECGSTVDFTTEY